MSITRNKNISFNQPILQGRRLTVFNIVFQLYLSEDLNGYLTEFDLSINDAREAVAYCSNTMCSTKFSQGDRFCDGCILNTISEGNDFDRTEYTEIKNNDAITISKSGDIIFFGTLDELEESHFGRVGWLIADFVKQKFPQLSNL